MSGPRRGEVWLVDLGLKAQARPAVVISAPDAAPHDRSLATLIPHTTSLRDSGFQAPVSVTFLGAGAFDAQSLITIPRSKLVKVMGKLTAAQLTDVEAVFKAWLGLLTGFK